MAQPYSNRTDLQNPAKKIAVQAAKGQAYGQAGAQIAAQKAMPMAQAPSDGVITAPEPVVQPGQFGPLDAMTSRPNEPITTGMDFGPGPGPEILPATGTGPLGSKDDLIMRVRQAAAKYPNPNLIQLLILLEGQ